MPVDEKHIKEIIEISKKNGKVIDREHAVVELERMRSIANIMIDTVLKMTPEERKALEQKIQKEKSKSKVKSGIKL